MTEENNPKKIENKNLEKEIFQRLETVIDPELGVDIVNIGLVYNVNLFEDGSCEIQITLTTMGCPFADVIEDDIRLALAPISDIKDLRIILVWYPAWDPSRMSRYAKIALGIR